MNAVRRANMLPAIEMLIAAAAASAAFYLGVRYDVASLLATLSDRSHLGVNAADLGPGFLVLATGLGVMSVRRWKEAVDERQALAEARDSLAGSEALYRSLVEVSPAPIVLTDSDGTIAFLNDAAHRLLRSPSPETLIGLPFAPFVAPEDQFIVQDANARLLRGERIQTGEVRLRRADGTAVVAQLVSAPATIDGAPGVQSVLQDVTHLAEVADALERACIDTVEAMARLAETRDPYTSGHQARVAVLAARMAEQMGLDQRSIRAVRVAGTVHDIGKMNVPIEILGKPGRLSDVEFELIKTHAQRGYEILRPIEFPWPIAEIVRQHHERMDGSGYPLGIRGEDILIEGRILAVADVLEAVASDRPYRPALGIDEALRVIEAGRGTIFDAACVDACKAVAREVIV